MFLTYPSLLPNFLYAKDCRYICNYWNAQAGLLLCQTTTFWKTFTLQQQPPMGPPLRGMLRVTCNSRECTCRVCMCVCVSLQKMKPSRWYHSNMKFCPLEAYFRARFQKFEKSDLRPSGYILKSCYFPKHLSMELDQPLEFCGIFLQT
jgi:hypothetical protein